MKTIDVFCLGNALMDIIVAGEPIDLEDLKLKKGTSHLVEGGFVDFALSYLEKRKKQQQAGGSASNTAAGIASLGGKAFFNGKVGRDKTGFDYEMLLRRQNIICDLKKDEFLQTGRVISVVTPDGERTFIAHIGSAKQFTIKDINIAALKKSKILHVEGYMLEEPSLKEATLHAMKIAKKNNIIVSADLSDPGLIQRNKPEFKEIVKKYVDILFVNESEAIALTDTEDIRQALDLMSTDVKLAIVKLGSSGSIMRIRKKVLKFEAYPVEKVVDTTGAGDMYAAGILYAIARGMSLEQAGKLASFAAAKIVEQPGARLEKSLQAE